MSQPQKYARSKNFQENSGDATDHGALNTEFDNIAATTDQIRSNLALIQADNGTLRPGLITEEQISSGLKALLKGDKGETGAQGPQGLQGETGPQGPKGDKGDTGASFLADAKGATDDKPLYDTRTKGFSFLDMTAGKLYWKLSNTPGDWSSGVEFGKGETGAQGPQGPQGKIGPQGERGPIGVTGDKGEKGDAGSDGVVTEVDSSQKSVNIVGRRRVMASLVLTNGKLSIKLDAE